jgi:tetratricopeptide (TPR) repeat protein
VDFDSLTNNVSAEGCFGVATIDRNDLSDNNRVLTIRWLNRETDYNPELFTFNKGLRDTRGNRIKDFFSFTYRRKDKLKRRYAVLNRFDPHHEEILKRIKNPFNSGNSTDWIVNAERSYIISDSYRRYPRLGREKRPAFEEHCFPPVEFYMGGGGFWNTGELRGKKSIFIICMGDGSIPKPDPSDMAQLAGSWYKPQDLMIVLCVIGVDKKPVDNLQKQMGKDIIVISDLQGCRGPIFNYLVHSKTMLPLVFFTDEKGIIKLSYTGFPSISCIVEGLAVMGLKPDLPEPVVESVKNVQEKIGKNPDDPANYLEMAKLYELAGNRYMAALYKYEAFIYGSKEASMRKEIYDNFMKWGLYPEAFDVMAEGHHLDPGCAASFFYAGEAACRFGMPALWNSNNYVGWSFNRCLYTGSFNGRDSILRARKNGYESNGLGRFIQFGDPPSSPMYYESQFFVDKITEYTNDFIKMNPGVSEPYVLRACVNSIVKDYKASYENLKTAEGFSDFSDRDRGLLAESSALSGKNEEAVKEAEKALNGCSSFSIHNALATVYFNEGKFKKAEEELDKCLALELWDYPAYYKYSESLDKNGDKKKADEFRGFFDDSLFRRYSFMKSLYMDITNPIDPSRTLNE